MQMINMNLKAETKNKFLFDHAKNSDLEMSPQIMNETQN